MDKKYNFREIFEERLPPDRALFISKMGAAAGECGFRAFIVGGSVRDLLMGCAVKDIDLTIEGDAEEFARKLLGEFKGKIVAHSRFKTASVFFRDGSRLDISTARKEKYKRPAELPEVVSSSIYSDLYRRDFTVNALAVSINPGSFGRLIDCFNGLEDLREGVIRVLHEKSFEDDPTRIFRAVRFAQRLGFRIEERTEALIRAAVCNRLCGALSGRRLRNEIELLLSEPDPVSAAKKMREYGIEKCIHRKLRVAAAEIGSLEKLRAIIPAAGGAAPDKGFRPWLVYFMGLLRGQDKETLREISKRLMLSTKERTALLSLPKADSMAKTLNSVEILPCSRVYSLLKGEPPEFLVVILSMTGIEKAKIILEKLVYSLGVKTETTGKDLLDMGFKPGPGIQAILDEVLKARIDGALKNKKEESDFILGKFKKESGN